MLFRKMATLMNFELKKISRPLLIGMMIFVLGSFGVIAFQSGTSKSSVTYDYNTSNSQTFWKYPNTKSTTKFAVSDFERIEKAARKVAADKSNPKLIRADANRAMVACQQLVPAINSQNNYKINKILLTYFEQSGDTEHWLADSTSITGSFRDHDVVGTTRELQYFVKHKINASIILSPETDILNLLAKTINVWPLVNSWSSMFGLIQMGILVFASLIFSYAFSYERRNQTSNFIRLTPMRELHLSAGKALINGALIILTIVLGILVTILVFELLPGGHRFGTLAYPHFYDVKGHAQMITIGQYLGVALLWIIAWLSLLCQGRF